MLFNFVGPDALESASEEELLGYIKSVAVKTVHPEVYRQQFFVMSQNDGETITCYISRLKAKAMLCTFTQKCDGAAQCTTNHSEDMIRSQLIAGLRNAAHQSKVLGEMQQLKTLDQLTERLLTLESTEQASSHLRPHNDASDGADVALIRSSYQSQRAGLHNRQDTPRPEMSRQSPSTPARPNSQPPSTSARPNNRSPVTSCAGCGQPAHRNRRKQCPAHGLSCHNCGKLHHFSRVCRSAKISTIQAESQDEQYSVLSNITTSPL